jgi:predicted transcriptional regulator
MERMTVKKYAESKGVTPQAIRKQIKIASKFGNKLKDGAFFEKLGRDYIIEIDN